VDSLLNRIIEVFLVEVRVYEEILNLERQKGFCNIYFRCTGDWPTCYAFLDSELNSDVGVVILTAPDEIALIRGALELINAHSV
jgi:hypothetical protein